MTEEKTAFTFREYSEAADKTAVYPARGYNITYPALGLAGEAGEVANKVKKLLRDSGGVMDEKFRQNVKKELGDVMWYINAVAFEAGLTLTEIAQANLDKLQGRAERGTLKGDGDDR